MAVLTAVAPERESFIAAATFSGTITVRKSCYAMTPEEIQNYRLAVSRIAQISAEAPQDQRGFQYIAGVHGLPGRYCKHGEPGFALWHRPYVQGYEQRLADVVPGAFVPYWDWSTRRAQSEGIPQMFLDETWDNPDSGQSEPNPLLAQAMTLIGRGATVRAAGDVAQLLSLRPLFQQALLAADYFALAADLENPHNQLHGWVGGSMNTIDTAAYDPLFWSHHSFVEYGFCQWQDAHPEAAVPVMDPRDFAPFSVTVDQVWNYHALGYAYEPDNASELRPAGVSNGPGASAVNTVRSGATVAHYPLFQLDPGDFDRADLRFEGLTPPVETFAVRVFADQPDADAGTPTDANRHYLGTRYFFGHGECGGTEGHCDPVRRDIFDLRPRHHYAPVHVRLNVTKRLKDFIGRRGPTKSNPSGDVPLTLVIVDPKGNEVHDPGLYFEGLSVVVR